METQQAHVPVDRATRGRETRRVALVGALVNLVLTFVKLVIGVMAQSAALVADGIHSLSDLLSDALVWYASLHASQEPDEEHPYGHGRFETAATLGLAILLGLVALGIVWESIERVWSGDSPTPGTIALYAAFFSIVANEALYWYTLIVARRIRSDMLRANAWHHRTDAISSVVVLAGVAGALLGWGYLDAVAAVVVGFMVAKIAWDLGREAMQELVDTALDEESVALAREVIMDVDGVRSLHLLRTRRHGPEASADVHIQVAPRLSVSEGHMISQTVEDQLTDAVGSITDVTVHIDPEDDEEGPPCRGLPLRTEALAELETLWPDLPSSHRLTLHYLSGSIDVELRLPISEYKDLAAADDLRSRLQDGLDRSAVFRKVDIVYQL